MPSLSQFLEFIGSPEFCTGLFLGFLAGALVVILLFVRDVMEESDEA